ncbi:MAG: outer membrane protein assembly factor BamD [Rhodothermales bacterium]
MRVRHSISVFLLLAAVLLASCAGAGRIRYDSPEEAYNRGMEHFEEGRYERAAQYFQGVFDYGRTTDVAADAQLNLGRAYFENGDYLLAANEYTRFISTYRNDPRAEEADYERALAYYELSPQYQLDQTNTRQAITYLQLFLDRYPNSDLKDEAEARIAELREKLAHKAYAAGGLYERREMYEAAALQYVRVFDDYPDTAWADDALLGAIRSYIGFARRSVEARQPERLRRAVENYERLVQLFPDSPLIEEAEGYYQDAVGQLEQLISGT